MFSVKYETNFKPSRTTLLLRHLPEETEEHREYHDSEYTTFRTGNFVQKTRMLHWQEPDEGNK